MNFFVGVIEIFVLSKKFSFYDIFLADLVAHSNNKLITVSDSEPRVLSLVSANTSSLNLFICENSISYQLYNYHLVHVNIERTQLLGTCRSAHVLLQCVAS